MTRDDLRAIAGRFSAMMTLSDTSFAEFIVSSELIGAGLWLLYPFEADTFQTIAVYKLLGMMAPEWVWGLTSLLIGSFQSCGNLCEHRNARRLAAALATAFFGFVSIFCFLAVRASIVVPLTGAVSFGQALIFLHLRKPGEADDGRA